MTPDLTAAPAPLVPPVNERPTLLSGPAYAEAWKLFRAVSDQRPLMLAWMESRAAELVPAAGSAHILSVGCGNGSFDIAALAHLRKAAAGSIRYTGVEPNSTLLDEFRGAQGKPDGVQFSFDPRPWGASPPVRDADVILMSHCLYYFQDQRAAVLHARDSLGPDGKLVVLQATEKGFAELRNTFTHQLTGEPYTYFTAEKLEGVFRDVGMTYRKELLPSRIDVTTALDPKSAEGLLILGFLVNVDLRGTDPNMIAGIRSLLEWQSVEDRGRRYLEHPVAAFIATAA